MIINIAQILIFYAVPLTASLPFSIQLACIEGRPGLVSEWIANGQPRDIDEDTASPEEHQQIISATSSTNALFRDKNFNDPLCLAATFGHTDILKLLIVDGKADPTRFRFFALDSASRCGHFESVKYLLENGRSINGIACALKWACVYGHENIVNFLIKNSDVDVWDQDGQYLNEACSMCHSGVVSILLSCPTPKKFSCKCFASAFHIAAYVKKDAFETISLLISHPLCNPNHSYHSGLKMLVGKGDVRTVRLLLENTKLPLKGRMGSSPITKAIKYDHVEMTMYLLEKEDDTSNYASFFRAACVHGSVKVVSAFLRNQLFMAELFVDYGNGLIAQKIFTECVLQFYPAVLRVLLKSGYFDACIRSVLNHHPFEEIAWLLASRPWKLEPELWYLDSNLLDLIKSCKLGFLEITQIQELPHEMLTHAIRCSAAHKHLKLLDDLLTQCSNKVIACPFDDIFDGPSRGLSFYRIFPEFKNQRSRGQEAGKRGIQKPHYISMINGLCFSSQDVVMISEADSILTADISQDPLTSLEALEAYLRPYTSAMEAMAEQFGYEVSTIVQAVLACHGNMQDAKRFLFHDFASLSAPPISRSRLPQLCSMPKSSK